MKTIQNKHVYGSILTTLHMTWVFSTFSFDDPASPKIIINSFVAIAGFIYVATVFFYSVNDCDL